MFAMASMRSAALSLSYRQILVTERATQQRLCTKVSSVSKLANMEMYRASEVLGAAKQSKAE